MNRRIPYLRSIYRNSIYLSSFVTCVHIPFKSFIYILQDNSNSIFSNEVDRLNGEMVWLCFGFWYLQLKSDVWLAHPIGCKYDEVGLGLFCAGLYGSKASE